MDSFLKPTRGSDAEEQEVNWKSRGNCHGLNPAIFFPERGASTKEAKAICKGCPINERCLEDVLSRKPDPGGVVAGTSKRERGRIRKARQRVVTAQSSAA